MADQYPITLAEFRAWLETKRPHEQVGYRRTTSDNPITRYLQARGDHATAGHAYVLADGRELQTPKWARAFLIEVAYDRSSSLVQARTALRLLDQVAHASLPAEELDHEHLSLELEAVNE